MNCSSLLRRHWRGWPCRPAFAVTTLAALLLLLSGASAARPALSLPKQIPPAERLKLEHVVENAFVSARMEREPYVARPDIFEYLLDHPAFATHVTRALKVARFRIWETKDGLFLDDGWGVKGHFAVVHAEAGTRIFHARGHFEHPLLPDIHGQAVVMIQYDFRLNTERGTVVATAVTGYVTVDSRILAAAGKLASPITTAKANLEARRLLKVFARVSRAIAERPDWVYEQLRQQPDVPRQELEEFRWLLERR